ncbi:MAG TPA: protein kinase [Chthoniobacterales bacterium]|nr:protein kinase [Chthoniobacterales bacterium]
MSSRDDSTSDPGFGATVRQFSASQRLFDRYVLKEILGRGGMGIVWLAADEQLERDVALKFLPEMVAYDEQAVSDLKRETKKSQELRHHHIVQVYDFVSDKQNACISMEYVDGSTLSAIKARKPQHCFEVGEIRDWVEQLCEALAYAHRKARIVHRDLKPANLMVNGKGDLKVTDFGIARSLTDSASMLTLACGTSGTLVYMSPQQLDGEKASHLDDIYSAGATLYELLTGKPPFYSGQIDRQIREKTPLSIDERRAELDLAGGAPVPPQWQEAIAACLAKDPAKRPQSASELSQRLGIAAVSSGSERQAAVATTTPPPVPMNPVIENQTQNVGKGRERLVLGIAAVLLVFASIIAAAVYFGSRAEKERERPESVKISAPLSSAAPLVTKSLEPAATRIQDAPTIVSVPQTLSQAPAPPVTTPFASKPSETTVPPISSSFGTSESFTMLGERYPETRTRLLAWEEVASWSDDKLRYAINEMYARGGYDFVKPEIRSLFLSQPWYLVRMVRGRTQDEAARHLSELEYRNLQLLQKVRDRKR